MISELKKKALSESLEIVMLSFFNKLTLNNMITRVSINEDLRQLNLSTLSFINSNSVINQKPGEEPYFFIHESVLITSFIRSCSSKSEEKEESSSFTLLLEIESVAELFHVNFDESSLWVKVECEKLNELWSEMLRIKCLEM